MLWCQRRRESKRDARRRRSRGRGKRDRTRTRLRRIVQLEPAVAAAARGKGRMHGLVALFGGARVSGEFVKSRGRPVCGDWQSGVRDSAL